MKLYKDSIVILASTGLLALLIITVSLTGILTTDFYSKETLNWQIQSLGQDMIDLFLITPALIVTGIMSAKKNRTALLLWAGVLLYIIYTFIIYCFDVHFNILFPIYCLILCVSFYSFVWFIYKQATQSAIFNPSRRTAKLTGIYFIVIASLFYFLWLSEIIPPIIKNGIPENIKASGLPTNPVHVIDLSFFLPAVFITGLFVLRQNPLGSICAPILLSFFILMDMTIGWLAFKMYQQGLASNLIVLFVMIFLTAISTVLLFYNLKDNHAKTELSLKEPLLTIKIIHTAIWVFFNVVMFYLLYAVIADRIDKWVWICLGLFALEGFILLLFRNMCPLTIMAKRFSDSTRDNFDIFLPNWLARYNKLIYSILLGISIVILIYRLIS